MSTPAAISVDDDLTACETCITLGTTNDELARGIDVQMCVVAKERERFLPILQLDLLEGLLDHFFNNQLVHFLHARSGHLRACVACTFLAAHSLGRLSMLG